MTITTLICACSITEECTWPRTTVVGVRILSGVPTSQPYQSVHRYGQFNKYCGAGSAFPLKYVRSNIQTQLNWKSIAFTPQRLWVQVPQSVPSKDPYSNLQKYIGYMYLTGLVVMRECWNRETGMQNFYQSTKKLEKNLLLST